MRKRSNRKSRSNMVLDIRKLYTAGLNSDVFRPIDMNPINENEFDVEFCESILKSNPEHFETLVLLGDAYTRKGEFGKGLELDLQLSKMKPNNKNIRYNLACSYALTGQKDKAITSLSKAVDLGYKDIQHVREDHDLDAIKNDPRFVTLLDRMNIEDVGQHK